MREGNLHKEVDMQSIEEIESICYNNILSEAEEYYNRLYDDEPYAYEGEDDWYDDRPDNLDEEDFLDE
jgi:hypothetical protein